LQFEAFLKKVCFILIFVIVSLFNLPCSVLRSYW